MKHKAAATALAASALLAAGAAQARPLFDNPATAPVNGLIVRLRDAPTHVQVEREQALSRDRRSALGERHRERLQRVLSEAALDRAAIDVPSAPAISATGSASHVLRFSKPLTLEQAQRLAHRLAARGDVLWVEPNTRERRLQSTTPNDPDFVSGLQWWLKPINTQSNNVINGLAKEQRLRGVPRFQEAWKLATGANLAATRVAVLDSGITDHEDLAGRWIGGYDFVSTVDYAGDGDGRDPDPHDPGDFVSSTSGAFSNCTVEDSSWHGTKIAGLISALTNNNLGVAGANQGNLIVPVRVAGKCGADVSDIVDGIRWAAGLTVANAPVNPNPARIINISFGGTAACSSEYQAAIDEVRALNNGQGAVVVAAAGNEHTAPTRPANCSNVIGVGALNRDGFKAVYSNFGTLTVSTVGGDPADTDNAGAWNTFLGDGGLWTVTNTGLQSPVGSGYENVIGTSFSAPLVSATVSLMLSLNSALTADQIVAGIKASARPHVVATGVFNNTTTPLMATCSDANPGRCVCTTSTCGAGILDAYEALRYAANPTGYSAPSRTAADINTAELVAAHTASAQDLPANPVTTPTTTPAGPCGHDGVCAGAMQPGWLLGLLAASAALLWGGRRVARAGRRS